MSHSGTIEMPVVNSITFEFNNINLPDSTVNEPESHGYIRYKIKPIPSIDVGDIMPNKAHIYFDFNPPIETNTVTTTIVDNLSVSYNLTNKVFIYPNPTKGIITIDYPRDTLNIKVYNQLGQLVHSNKNSKTIDISELTSGLYFITIETIDGKSSTKKIVKN